MVFLFLLHLLLFPLITGPNDLSISNMFEGMFDEITNEIEIMPDDSAYVSYDLSSSNAPLLWGIQIIDYVFWTICCLLKFQIFLEMIMVNL